MAPDLGHEAVPVKGLLALAEPLGHSRCLSSDTDGLLYAQLDLAPQPVAQALALDIRHGIPQQPARLTRVVDGKNVGVLESGGRADFAEEALRAERDGQLGVE